MKTIVARIRRGGGKTLNYLSAVIFALALAAALPSFASNVFNVANSSTVTYTFGSPVGDGETKHANIDSPETFAFRSGTVNINAGGSVKVGGGKSSNYTYGNWIGANGNAATLNINGGTFWSYGSSQTAPYGLLRIGVNGGANESTVNLNSGTLKARVAVIGGSLYDGYDACAKKGVVNISGGTAEIETLYLGTTKSQAAAANGGGYASATLNLIGGTLEVSKFNFCAYHTQAFNWGGGTLVAAAADVFSSTPPLANCTRTVNVSGTPAVFNTGNFAQTLPADIAGGTGTLKLTGGNTVTISAAPSFGLWLDGTTLAFAPGFSSNVTVPSVTLGSGAGVVFDADSIPSGSSFTLTSTAGFTLPDGGGVLDFVQIVGNSAADCEKALSADGKTITVSKPGDPDYTWRGTATNWGDADAWVNDDANATWADGNNAIFSTANATATLDADATAADVVFNADATIATNGTDAAALTVSTVSVASGVTATISAPTAGALEKTGAGTLVLGASRSAATTVTEGTLRMLSGSTVSALALGADGGAPVVFDYGGQSLQKDPADYLVTGSDVTLTNGTFWLNGELKIRDSTKIPAVLTIAKDATLRQRTGNIIVLDKAYGTATVNIDGGTLQKASGNQSFYFQNASTNGTLHVNVTNGGAMDFSYKVYAIVAMGEYPYLNPSLYWTFSDSTFRCSDSLDFGYDTTTNPSYLPVSPTGVIAATNSSFCVNGAFRIGRTAITEGRTAGSYTANFESCVVTTRWFAVYHDRPLNNARFNNTRFAFSAAGGSIVASDGADNWITVGDDGLTIDTQAYACTLDANLGGSGTVTKVGAGTLTVTSNQTATAAFNVNEGTLAINGGVSVSRPVMVASDATLTVNATDTATIDTLALDAGSTLNIAAYDGTTPFAVATSATLPVGGTVILTLNGGEFPVGIYAIYSKSGVTAADGAKFAPSTGGELANWSVEYDTLVLTVGDVDPNVWTGRGGDGRLSTAANWAGNAVPAAGADIDLSGISADTTLIADADRTFGAVTMGDAIITFTGSLSATSFVSETTANPTVKVAVGADSTVTIAGDLVFATNVACYVCYSIADGGTFAVTGDIIATSAHTSYVAPCETSSNAGVIFAKGLVNNINNNGDYFGLARQANNALAKWVIGEDGLSGTKRFYVGNSSGATAMITAATNFTISAGIVQYRNLTLDTAGYEITLGTNTLAKSGGILRGGSASNSTTVTGSGKVVVNYNVNDLATAASSRTNAFTVANGATLTFAPGGNIGFGALTVQNGGTLEIQSGTTTFGNLTVEENAILGFNFTDRRNAPVLALYSGAEVNALDPFTVKVSGTVWPSGGEKLLTTCGGFTAANVTLVEGAPKWVRGLSVNDDGNIVLDVKPMGTVILFR